MEGQWWLYLGVGVVVVGGGVVVWVVPEGEVWIVERLGRFHRLLGPGLRWGIRGLDRVVGRYPTGERFLKLELRGWSRDRVPVEITGIGVLKIVDPVQFHYRVGGDWSGVAEVLRGGVGGVVGKTPFQQLVEQLPEVEGQIVEVVAPELEGWGVELKSLFLSYRVSSEG